MKISNSNKELYPGITKQQIADYYVAVSKWMLTYVNARPLVLVRYPNGYDQEHFFQKNTPAYYPDFIKRISVAHENKTLQYVIAETAEALEYFSNQAALELHMLLSCKEHLDKPDVLIFDLDPSLDFLDWARDAARDLRSILEKLGITSFLKTTGKKGYHVSIPLKPTASFADVKEVAKAIAQVLVQQNPKKYTLEFYKKDRKNRVFIDYLRNEYGQSAIAPYSLRATKNATVCMPIRWDELDTIRPDEFTMSSAITRLNEQGDAWKDYPASQYDLAKLKQQLVQSIK